MGEAGDMYTTHGDWPNCLVLRADKGSVLLLVSDGTHGTPTTYTPYTELTGEFRRATFPELQRGARAIFAFLGTRPGAYVTGYDRELLDAAVVLLAIAEARSGGCPHGDRLCPCQDGDPCHYEGDDPAVCPRTRTVGCDCRAGRKEFGGEHDDVHNLPSTWDHQRQHELTRTCWCGPGTKPRIGGPGRLVVHAGGAS